MTTLVENTTNVPAEGSGRDEDLAHAEIATLTVMFVVAVVGNMAVLLALFGRPRKKLSRMYYFILHLSIADLCTAFLSILPQLAWDITFRFKGGPVLCKLVKYGQTLGPYLSAYILMATALDRYQAICHPLVYSSWSSRRSRFMVWTAWIFALAFCIPQVIVFSYEEVEPGVFDCWATFIPGGERTYVTWYCVSVFIVPFTVLATTYCCICREVWLHVGHSPHSTRIISRAKINTIKQMVAVLLLYMACSAPFISAQLWATWDDLAATRPFYSGTAFTILALLYSLNSCMNPWIYLAFNRELIRFLTQQFFCRSKNASIYKSGFGGSGSSTGIPAEKKKTCNSTLVADVNTNHVKPSIPHKDAESSTWSCASRLSRSGAIRRSPLHADRKIFACSFLGKTDHKCIESEPVKALLQLKPQDCRRLEVHI